MAVDKLVDSSQLDSDLTSVANAIRAKSGGSGQLAFPAGFVSEIGNIPSGGGGDYTAQDWLDLSKPTGEIVSDVTFVDTGSGGWVLYGRTGITKYTDLLSTGFPQQFFASCSGLQYIVAPKAIFGRSTICGYCTNLLGVDFFGEVSGAYIFRNCTKLKHLVLRSTTVQSLSNANSFNFTPFASNGTGGTLYVPNNLISSYQSASNWSTILGYTNNQIKSIESTHTDPNAPVDLTTHYIDGTLIPTT